MSDIKQKLKESFEELKSTVHEHLIDFLKTSSKVVPLNESQINQVADTAIKEIDDVENISKILRETILTKVLDKAAHEVAKIKTKEIEELRKTEGYES